MDYQLNLDKLKRDFRKGRRFTLFVGAGINAIQNVHLLWNELIKKACEYSFRVIGNNLSLNTDSLNLLMTLLGIKEPITAFVQFSESGNIKEEALMEFIKLKDYANCHFPIEVQVSIIKTLLGDFYISFIQDYLYEQCNEVKIRKYFEAYKRQNADTDSPKEKELHSLYVVARLILLNPQIETVISYNYDNFLSTAIKYLLNNANEFFSTKEIEFLRLRYRLSNPVFDKVCPVVDVGDKFNVDQYKDWRAVPIFHVHGYIPAPNQLQNIEDSAIILSMDNMTNYANSFYYPDYKNRAGSIAEEYLRALFDSQIELKAIEGREDRKSYSLSYIAPQNNDENDPDHIFHAIIRNALLGERSDRDMEVFGWIDHYASTAIVGNPNSYKRKLVLGRAFHWAKLKEHVLFVLFDKNEEDLRRMMTCPGMLDRAKDYYCKDVENNSSKDNNHPRDKKGWNCDSCKTCYKYIHFFRIRSGCISPEEFFAALLEQISVYCDEETKYGIERRRMHIVIDDFQRIDFCFPFIKESSLFTDALINLCHLHNVELTILCDKSGERAREVCTLADNVVCVERNEHDLNNISIYIERSAVAPFPSAIFKYQIPDVQNLFKCDDKSLRITSDECSKPKPFVIGSMKEYWRQTGNVYIKEHK